ncbi:uncharacterized protein DS421_5g155240 [Arachis hypogaea]|nr:uncharacterized protein DS421_5g155240 [Arachis hypogaea]
MPSEPSLSDLESRPTKPSKVTESIREVLNEFLNMSKLMFQSHKATRKLAYENERAWQKCQERVGLMIQSFEDEMWREDKKEDSGSEYNLSDD